MHTLRVIGAGLVLLAVFLVVARFVAGARGAGLAKAALWFVPVWLAASVVNLWIGVSQAGYTVAQELPILLVVFGVPAAIALLIRTRLARA